MDEVIDRQESGLPSASLNGENFLGKPLGELGQHTPQSDEEAHFFNLSLDMLCITGFDGYLKQLNPAWEKTLGYSSQTLLNQPWIEFVHPDDRSTTIVELQRGLDGASTVHFEHRFRCHDGSYKWLSWQANPLTDKQIFYAVARDITRRKQNAEALEKVHLQVVNIFESITDAFLALNHDWQFTYLNPRAEQILLQSKEDIIGCCIWEELPDIVNSTFARECQRAIAQQTTVHFEEFYDPLGIWLEVRAYPYQEGLSVYFRDVSSRKRAEVALLERTRLFGLGAEIGMVLGQGGNLPEMLDRCVQSMVEHLDVSFARIWLLNRETHLLELEAIAGQHSHTEDFYNRIPLGISIIGFIGYHREPYVTNTADSDMCIGAKEWIQRERLIGFAGYPLIVEDRLVGVLALFSQHPFTEAVKGMLESVTNSIAVAIDRAWAREELLSRREALLFRLANQIRNSLDLNTILSIAVNEIRNLLQIDRCHFLWCESLPDRLSVTISHEACDTHLPSLLGDCSEEQATLLSEKILSLAIVRTEDAARDTELDSRMRSLLPQMGIVSQLLIPLETRSGQLGAVVCSHCSKPRVWSDSEVELLQAVVDQLSLAIDQAELYAQSRAAALAAQAQAQQLTATLQDLQKTQSQLIHSEKMSSLGQMVAGIAHEINNPVNFIMGNLSHGSEYIHQLLEILALFQAHYPEPAAPIQAKSQEIDLEFLAADLPKLLSSMKIGAERIRQIVLSLRNFSRLDEAAKKPVDIHEGIDSTLLILQSRLKPDRLSPEIRIIKDYGNLPPINCYAGQLNQVFMNILSNAIDALQDPREDDLVHRTTPPPSNSEAEAVFSESPAIYITTQCLNNDRAEIRIRDEGPGMTEDVAKHLFDPFFTTKPVGQGTGLGLSISYQIVVEKHGGTLRCSSRPGQGAEFVIEIPISDE
ncbi:MAG: PAS domain S-box protein [Scytolyngbya sp. HA4215-MV1]|jgi:PAS domain S-box-containing protein|nr:PAS domain S-box protein [Scytolyngbya sp. HA4215-MV1]